MPNITIDINIHAPELAKALQILSNALVSAGIIMTGAKETIDVSAGLVQAYEATAVPASAQYAPQQIQAPMQAPQPFHAQPVGAAPQQFKTPMQTPVQSSAPPGAPSAPLAYTMDQLAVAATQLMDAGKRNDLVALLGSFGVQALTALPKEQYGAFATQLRAMGAKL